MAPMREVTATTSRVQQLFSLVGQTALVVDGAGNVGRAAAIALAKAGADILLVEVRIRISFLITGTGRPSQKAMLK